MGIVKMENRLYDKRQNIYNDPKLIEIVSSGEIENQLMRAANRQGQSAGAIEVCP